MADRIDGIRLLIGLYGIDCLDLVQVNNSVKNGDVRNHNREKCSSFGELRQVENTD